VPLAVVASQSEPSVDGVIRTDAYVNRRRIVVYYPTMSD
jgi:hypothetical protein